MNALELRINDRDKSGECELSPKKKTEVFNVELPIGSAPVTMTGEALLQEVRSFMLKQKPDQKPPKST